MYDSEAKSKNNFGARKRGSLHNSQELVMWVSYDEKTGGIKGKRVFAPLVTTRKSRANDTDR